MSRVASEVREGARVVWAIYWAAVFAIGGSALASRRERDRAAIGTLPTLAPVLGDVRRDRRQLRYLMAARFAERMPGVQAALGLALVGIRDCAFECGAGLLDFRLSLRRKPQSNRQRGLKPPQIRQ